MSDPINITISTSDLDDAVSRAVLKLVPELVFNNSELRQRIGEAVNTALKSQAIREATTLGVANAFTSTAVVGAMEREIVRLIENGAYSGSIKAVLHAQAKAFGKDVAKSASSSTHASQLTQAQKDMVRTGQRSYITSRAELDKLPDTSTLSSYDLETLGLEGLGTWEFYPSEAKHASVGLLRGLYPNLPNGWLWRDTGEYQVRFSDHDTPRFKTVYEAQLAALWHYEDLLNAAI